MFASMSTSCSSAEQIDRSAEDITGTEILLRHREIDSYLASHSHRLLDKPIAIPQSHKDVGMPFARAYSEVLEEFGISKECFIDFIDELNVVTAGSPPFQYAGIAGDVLGNIPIPHAMWVGMGISGGAQVGQIATSLVREKVFIKRKNKDTFASKGLKVEVVKSKTLKERLGLSRDASIVAPIEESIASGMSVHERRLANIRHLIAPLTFDVPPPSEASRNMINQMNASAQKRRLQRQEEKVLKHRERYSEAAKSHEERIEEKQRKFSAKLEYLQEKVNKQETERARRREKNLGKDMSPERRARKLAEIDEEIDYEIKYINKDIKYLKEAYESRIAEMAEELKEEDREAQIGEKVYWVLIQNI